MAEEAAGRELLRGTCSSNPDDASADEAVAKRFFVWLSDLPYFFMENDGWEVIGTPAYVCEREKEENK